MHDIAHAAANAARVPDFADVLARGRQRRNRRHALIAGAVSLAVVAIIGAPRLIGGGDSGRPEPAPSPPSDSAPVVSTAPPEIPFSENGRLDIGHEVVDTNLRDIRYAAGTTVVGTEFLGGNHWFLVTDSGRMVPVLESDNRVRLVVSPDGEVLAWVESTSDTTRTLVEWDVATHEVIDAVEIPVNVQCCDLGGELFIQGVDLEHRVVFSTDRAWVWDPGSDAVEVKGVDQQSLVSDPWPGGLMYQGRGGASGFKAPTGIYGTLDADGRFRRVGIAPVDQGGSWSPGGTSYAFAGEFDGLMVFRDGAESDLPLPSAGSWSLVGWESETTLIAELRGRLVARCDVVALACVALDQRPTLRTTWPDNRAG